MDSVSTRAGPEQLCDLMTTEEGHLMLPSWQTAVPVLCFFFLSESDARVADGNFVYLSAELNLRIPHGVLCGQKCIFSHSESLQRCMFLVGEKQMTRNNNKIYVGDSPTGPWCLLADNRSRTTDEQREMERNRCVAEMPESAACFLQLK